MNIAEILLYAVLAGAFLLLIWVLAPRLGEYYAQRRVSAVLANDEQVVFKTRCDRHESRFPFFRVRGTCYVTNRRLLWKTDFMLLPTNFEQTPIADVIDVAVQKWLWDSRVELSTSAGRVKLWPRSVNPFWWGGGQQARALAEYIENHPLRRVGATV